MAPLTQVAPFQRDGVWWRPDSPDAKAYGTLRYDPDDALRLKLLDPPDSDPSSPDRDAFTLLGETLAGAPYSLLDTFATSTKRWLSGGHVRQELVARMLVAGAHVERASELRFGKVAVGLRGLREFLWQSGGEGEVDNVVSVPGCELQLRLGWSGSSTGHRETREREATATFVFDEPVDLDVCLDRCVTPLRDLITFSTRQPSRLESFLAFVRPDAAAASAGDESDTDTTEDRDELVEFVWGPPDLLLPANPKGYHRALFTFPRLGDHGAEVIQRWFELHAELGGAANFLFGALSTRLYLESRLVTLMSAAEAYHRTFHDEPRLSAEAHDELRARMLAALDTTKQRSIYESSLRYADQQTQRQRLRWLADRAASAGDDLVGDTKSLCTQLVDTRNYFTHLGDQDGEALAGGAPLYGLIERLLLVLRANLLLDLGFGAQAAGEALRASYHGDPFI